MPGFDFTSYLSPFTWRYGSNEMRHIWSEIYKRKLWRKIWISLATAQHKQGLVNKEELDDLIKHQNDIDIDNNKDMDRDIRHNDSNEENDK